MKIKAPESTCPTCGSCLTSYSRERSGTVVREAVGYRCSAMFERSSRADFSPRGYNYNGEVEFYGHPLDDWKRQLPCSNAAEIVEKLRVRVQELESNRTPLGPNELEQCGRNSPGPG